VSVRQCADGTGRGQGPLNDGQLAGSGKTNFFSCLCRYLSVSRRITDGQRARIVGCYWPPHGGNFQFVHTKNEITLHARIIQGGVEDRALRRKEIIIDAKEGQADAVIETAADLGTEEGVNFNLFKIRVCRL